MAFHLLLFVRMRSSDFSLEYLYFTSYKEGKDEKLLFIERFVLYKKGEKL